LAIIIIENWQLDIGDFKNMDYLGLIKKSAKIVWQHEYLFWLGILASLTAGGSNFNISIGTFNFQDLPQIFKKGGSGSDESRVLLGKVLGASTSANNFLQNFGDIRTFLADHIFWLILISFILLLLIIMLVVVSISARGGLIFAAEKIEKNEKTDFSESFSVGWSKLFSLVGVSFLLGLIAFAVFAIFSFPVVLLAFIPRVGLIFSIISGFLGLLIFILFSIFLGYISQIAYRAVIIEEEGIIASLSSAYKLVKNNLSEIIIIWLVNVLSSFVYAAATIFIFVVIGLFFILSGLGIAILSKVVLIFYIIFSALILLAVGLFLSGIFHSFISTFWTLAYLEIAKREPQEK